MIKKTTLAALTTCLAAAAMPASATLLTNVDGSNAFTGFDWAQGGTAFATGFSPTAGTDFTLTYFAYATNVVNGIFNIPASTLPHLDTVADGVPSNGAGSYEYTIVATLNETVTSCTATECHFSVSGGSWNILYDTAANANAKAGALGTGFTDGVPIMSGNINPLADSVFSLINGSNSTTLTGQVVTTNPAFVAPPFTNTTATTTLQLGGAITNWVNPGGFNGVAFTGADNPIFQADGNQSFSTRVPEPGSVALLGLSLGVVGWSLRRRQQ
jgi:hypothetical protein